HLSPRGKAPGNLAHGETGVCGLVHPPHSRALAPSAAPERRRMQETSKPPHPNHGQHTNSIRIRQGKTNILMMQDFFREMTRYQILLEGEGMDALPQASDG